MKNFDDKQASNRQIQAYADECFEEYKEYLPTLIFKNFSVNYQTLQDFTKNWRKQYVYTAECEDFLKLQTRVFLRNLSSNEKMISNPTFLKILLHNICKYLSAYIARKTHDCKRQDVEDELFDEFFTNNEYLKKKINSVEQTQQRTHFTKRETPEQKHEAYLKKLNNEMRKQRAQRRTLFTKQQISLTPEQKNKLYLKQLNDEIRKKRAQLKRFNSHTI